MKTKTKAVVRRVVATLAVLVVVTIATMLLLELTPGDPAYAILGDNATPERVEALREDLGLNESVVTRYVSWIGDVLQGDLGRSPRTQQAVVDSLGERLPVTLQIALMALSIALVVSIPAAVYTAFRAGKLADRATQVATSLIVSSPPFVIGVMLATVFGLQLGWVPVSGWTPLSESLTENLKGAVLPAITLSVTEISVFTRLLRNDLLATLQHDYILAARAKGLSSAYILFRHALRPSSFSLVTLAGLALGRLIGGAVVIEIVFGLPGVGQLLVQAVNGGDLVVVQGIVLVVAVFYVIANAGVDILYHVLDPRTKATAR